MKSNKILKSVIALSSLALVGCNRGESSVSLPVDADDVQDTSANVGLNLSVYYQDDSTHMKFLESGSAKLPYKGADGNTYNAGDFKPVWKQLQSNLNFTITDSSPTGKRDIKTTFTSLVSSKFQVSSQLVNIAQGNSDQIVSEGTNNGTILDLNDYLDMMPNFKNFLETNPIVKKTIQNSDGKLYYAPYFDGFDDIERMLMLRKDWVEKLLDGDLPSDLDSTAIDSKNYTPFYTSDISSSIKVLNSAESGTETITKTVKAEKNIIKIFNDTASLTGASAVQLLRNYIDSTYGTTYGTKRSELFVGGRAVYDIDELVALFKCVKANAKFLTGDAKANIVSFFPRAKTNDRTLDLFRFLQFFGVRGVESRNNYFYVGTDGKLHDARMSEGFVTGLEKLHQMYQDGLIFEQFTTAQINKKDDYRGPLLTCSFAEDSTKNDYGFATYDYNQTTTVYNDTTKSTGMEFVSVLPAVADFEDGTDGNLIHYTESWRSVKTQGWFITAETANEPAKLARCLKLFDYLYSDEGNRLMSFGPDAYLKKNTDGSVATMDYQGKNVPVLSDDCKAELKSLTSGNYTNYYRYYLGGTFPVGYVKEQGMEYQTVSTKAQPSLNMINHAIQYGVLEHVNHKDNNTSHMQDIVPTTFPFTASENSTLGTDYTSLNKEFSSSKNDVTVMSKIVIDGFGTIDGYDFSKAKFIETVKTTLKCESFVTYYNDAYERFLAF